MGAENPGKARGVVLACFRGPFLLLSGLVPLAFRAHSSCFWGTFLLLLGPFLLLLEPIPLENGVPFLSERGPTVRRLWADGSRMVYKPSTEYLGMARGMILAWFWGPSGRLRHQKSLKCCQLDRKDAICPGGRVK